MSDLIRIKELEVEVETLSSRLAESQMQLAACKKAEEIACIRLINFARNVAELFPDVDLLAFFRK